ncbi:MAG: glutathione S-transferase [Pseudomonadota bacterium]
MSYTLYLGDRSYSSWSMRIGLLCDAFDLPVTSRFVDFSHSDVATQLAEVAPARTVPTLKTPEGAIISESLAIAEELATRFPDRGILPADPFARATARSLASEMHAGFAALREACPMNLRAAYTGFAPSEEVLADLARLEDIWSIALDASDGPWLSGAYSMADAFFAPVAMRMATYGLPIGQQAQAYVEQHLTHLPFRRWRAMGLVSGETLPWYKRDYPTRPWPGPKPLDARPVEDGARSKNTQCPFSGGPVSHFLELGGRVFGFCNAFCRDKTVADPEAWPAFMAITR